MDKANWKERTEQLLGPERVKELSCKHVLIVGLGGVGGMAAEMLVRGGIGGMTIVDADIVQPSNINRQIVALHSVLCQPKAEVLSLRLRDINPELSLEVITEFVHDDSLVKLLERRRYDYVIDAIDSLSPKVHLIFQSLKLGYKIISSMGAGAKQDPSSIKVSDLSKSYNCHLARALRKRLRKLGLSRGLPVVFSSELPQEDAIIEVTGERNKKSTAGTISYMPAMFGCHLAAYVLRNI